MEKSLKSKTTFLVKKKLIYIFLNCYVQSKKWKLYICTISYLEINKSSVSNLICRLLSLVFFSCSPPYKCPAVITQHIWVPFVAVSFSPLRIYPVGNFHLARQRRVPYFQGKKIQVRLQEMKSTTFCTPKHCMWREAPPRFLLSFLNFFSLFPKSGCIRFETRHRLFYGQHSIYSWNRDFQKAVLLEDRRKYLLSSWPLLCVGIFTLNSRVRSRYTSPS